MTYADPTPAVDTARIRTLLERELALPARVRYVALLLGTLALAGALAALWLTEPTLPLRTHLAFAVLTSMTLGWAAHAGWVLARRRVLYGRQQVVAGRMAVAFSAIYTLGALAAGASAGRPDAGAAAAGVGLLMLAAASVVLARAHRHHEALVLLKQTLEAELRASRP